MEYDFKYEHFNSVYDFEKIVNGRDVNEYFTKKQKSHGEDSCWYKTENYDEAQSLLLNGWNAEVGKIDDELKKFKRTVEVLHKKQFKSVAGFAPCVPNAILGVPKSMFVTRDVKRKDNKRSVHIIINNTANGNTDSEELMRSGITCLKLAYVLDRIKVRTKIDVIPKMSINGNSCYGCTVSIKDYRQPFNLSKMAYPLAHTSFFRRHGFRFFETMTEFSNASMANGYGVSMLSYKGQQIFKDYMKFAGFMKDDVVYIDLDDVRKADFDYIKLAELKGIALN